MLLLIDNYDSFTFNLVQALQELGACPRVVRHDHGSLPALGLSPDLEGVIISPGPGGPE
ncbi:MAG: glutamine amidotransferase-related protein, partial [Thermodesulfobacteriota bacterium]